MTSRISKTLVRIAEYLRVRLPLPYLAALFAVHAYLFLRWPIQAVDTDLWYHLESGRYIWTHHVIPHTSYFSFISPVRQWADYYWLFQVLIYRIYAWGNYYGLILFRTIVYLSTMTLIVRYLLQAMQHTRRRYYPVILSALYFVVLIPRSLLVRPHVMTYGFITLFLYILEFAPRYRKHLPWLAILWCNFHGITYPVMLLITGAYTLEYFVHRARGRLVHGRKAQQLLLPVVLSMAAIYVTPHGFRLLRIPFTPMSYTAQFIQEFRLVSFENLSSFSISGFIPTYATLFNLLLVAAWASLALSLSRGSVRISHGVLFAGGLLLLTKGARFVVECALLALPMLTTNRDEDRTAPRRRRRLTAEHLTRGAVITLLMVIPVLFSLRFFANRSRYPLSYRSLPQGVCAFLKRVDVGGGVLNDPDPGGYLRWELTPRYKIFMDLEVPFLFTTEDLYSALGAFRDAEVLRHVLSQYDPAFIAVPITAKTFPELIKPFSDYVVAFFDDVDVLYVNKHRYPLVAQRYELHDVNPFEFAAMGLEKFMAEHKYEALLTSLPTLLSIYPECYVTNTLLARIYNDDKAYDRALPFTEQLIRAFPDSQSGYALRGDALLGLQQFNAAITSYRFALEHSGDQALYKKIGRAFLGLGRYRDAYGALKKSFDVFSAEASLEDLYLLGSTAQLAGQHKDAEAILTYLYKYRIPPEKADWLEKVKSDLTHLGIDVEHME